MHWNWVNRIITLHPYMGDGSVGYDQVNSYKCQTSIDKETFNWQTKNQGRDQCLSRIQVHLLQIKLSLFLHNIYIDHRCKLK
jgi:hypothetical protein